MFKYLWNDDPVAKKECEVTVSKPAFTCSKLKMKAPEQLWSLFKVNEKYTKNLSLAMSWWLFCYVWTN